MTRRRQPRPWPTEPMRIPEPLPWWHLGLMVLMAYLVVGALIVLMVAAKAAGVAW